MYNEITEEAVTLELPNLVAVANKGAFDGCVVGTHSFLLPLMEKLARARPQWRFVGRRIGRDGMRGDKLYKVAVSFDVYFNNEKLGTVEKDYDYAQNCDRYSIHNTRIEANRVRGSAVRTKNLTKALKTVLKEFYVKTTNELLEEAASSVNNAVHHVHHACNYAHSRNTSATEVARTDFARDNWDSFAPYARAKGVSTEVIDTYPETEENYHEALTLYSAHINRTGVLVVLRGDDYIIKKGEEVTIRANADLTDHLRRGIGLLKLAEPKVMIPGVGVKSESGAMFLFDEPKQKETKQDGDK